MALPVITGLDRALSSLERQVYETAHRRTSMGLRLVIAYARQSWPIGHGNTNKYHSRDRFYLEDKSNGRDRVHWVVNNDAKDKRGVPYAFYIRSPQVPGAGAARSGMLNAWLVLIRRPVLKELSDIAADIADFRPGED